MVGCLPIINWGFLPNTSKEIKKEVKGRKKSGRKRRRERKKSGDEEKEVAPKEQPCPLGS